MLIEHCDICDSPTGNTSIYVEIGGEQVGPLCNECYEGYLAASPPEIDE